MGYSQALREETSTTTLPRINARDAVTLMNSNKQGLIKALLFTNIFFNKTASLEEAGVEIPKNLRNLYSWIPRIQIELNLFKAKIARHATFPSCQEILRDQHMVKNFDKFQFIIQFIYPEFQMSEFIEMRNTLLEEDLKPNALIDDVIKVITPQIKKHGAAGFLKRWKKMYGKQLSKDKTGKKITSRLGSGPRYCDQILAIANDRVVDGTRPLQDSDGCIQKTINELAQSGIISNWMRLDALSNALVTAAAEKDFHKRTDMPVRLKALVISLKSGDGGFYEEVSKEDQRTQTFKQHMPTIMKYTDSFRKSFLSVNVATGVLIKTAEMCEAFVDFARSN